PVRPTQGSRDVRQVHGRGERRRARVTGARVTTAGARTDQLLYEGELRRDIRRVLAEGVTTVGDELVGLRRDVPGLDEVDLPGGVVRGRDGVEVDAERAVDRGARPGTRAGDTSIDIDEL